MGVTDQVLLEKIKQLPQQKQVEVINFIDFLRTRDESQHLVYAAAKIAETSFAAVWDNAEDAAYDKL